MLEVTRLDAFYGDSQILHGLSFAVPAGGRVAILGRNGAGKSTLLKSLMNAGPTVRGQVSFEGRELGPMRAWRRARLGLALVPEDRRIFGHLSVRENIALSSWGATPARPPLDAMTVIDRIPMLRPLADRPGGQLSGGQQQMVAVARGIAARPKLMMLDEPTEGLAPRIVEEMARDIVATCAADGAGLLLCEQNIWFARRCTSWVYVLDNGRIRFDGTWDSFDADSTIAERHLAV